MKSAGQIKAGKIINAIKKGIQANPTKITLNINEKKIIDGCFENITAQTEITCIIYWNENQQATKNYIDKPGITQENMKWNLICDGNFDMTITQDRKIDFVHPISKTKFHINHSYPFIVDNIICGYECELKEIS